MLVIDVLEVLALPTWLYHGQERIDFGKNVLYPFCGSMVNLHSPKLADYVAPQILLL